MGGPWGWFYTVLYENTMLFFFWNSWNIVGVSATKELSAEKIPADELQVISETKEHIDEDLPGTVLENVENAKA